MTKPSIKLPDERNYASLPSGRCHYRLDGPESGNLILLLHGATVSGWIFERLRPYLEKANYRLLTIDLLGHGYSARPRTSYDIALFKCQINEIFESDAFQSLDVKWPISVIGHSLGAAIAASIAVDNPRRFSGVVLTAPLINFIANMPAVKLFKTPLLGEILNRCYVIPMLKRRRKKRYAPIDDGRFIAKFLSQFLIPGFERTVLSLFRSSALGDQTDLYRAFNQLQLSTLVIYGQHDELVTLEQIEHLKTLLSKAQFVGLEKAGHAFILGEPERIANKIINFLLEK